MKKLFSCFNFLVTANPTGVKFYHECCTGSHSGPFALLLLFVFHYFLLLLETQSVLSPNGIYSFADVSNLFGTASRHRHTCSKCAINAFKLRKLKKKYRNWSLPAFGCPWHSRISPVQSQNITCRPILILKHDNEKETIVVLYIKIKSNSIIINNKNKEIIY